MLGKNLIQDLLSILFHHHLEFFEERSASLLCSCNICYDTVTFLVWRGRMTDEFDTMVWSNEVVNVSGDAYFAD